MNEHDHQMLELIIDNLQTIKRTLDELLRRFPEPRCQYCGLGSGYHSQQFGMDHDFIP